MTEATINMEAVSGRIDPKNLLAGIKVEKPQNIREKTRKFLCGIKRTKENERFQFQIRVGPVAFASKTFSWEGVGDEAVQNWIDGAVYELSEQQVHEIRAKLQYRYLRPKFTPGEEGKAPILSGYEDVDASDGGGIDPKTGEVIAPKSLPRRLRGDETPLLDLIVFEMCHQDTRLGGKTLTVKDLEAMLAEARAEEAREVDSGLSHFEEGKGGKAMTPKAESSRSAKEQKALSTASDTKKGTAGFLPG